MKVLKASFKLGSKQHELIMETYMNLCVMTYIKDNYFEIADKVAKLSNKLQSLEGKTVGEAVDLLMEELGKEIRSYQLMRLTTNE